MTEDKNSLVNSENRVVEIVPMVTHLLGSCIPISDYNNLYQQYKLCQEKNESLKNQIINGDIKKLNLDSERLKDDIIRLSKENKNLLNNRDKLRKKFKKLEEINENLRKKIKVLENENKRLEEIIKQQDKKIEEQNTKMSILEQKMKQIEDDRKLDKLKDKLKLAIIDIDQIYQLEKTEDKHFSKTMWLLRENRDNECHYIRNKGKYIDSEEIKQYKLFLIKEKLIEYKKLGDKSIKYVDKLIKIINDNSILKNFDSINTDEKNEGEEWWIN